MVPSSGWLIVGWGPVPPLLPSGTRMFPVHSSCQPQVTWSVVSTLTVSVVPFGLKLLSVQ